MTQPQLILDALRAAVEAVPDTFISDAPEAAYKEMTVHLVRELAARGVGFAPLKIPATAPRKRGTPVCQSNLNGVGPCVLQKGHEGQHRTRMGDKFG